MIYSGVDHTLASEEYDEFFFFHLISTHDSELNINFFFIMLAYLSIYI